MSIKVKIHHIFKTKMEHEKFLCKLSITIFYQYLDIIFKNKDEINYSNN